ncbi:15816_t:CDS:2 [Funneliformis geosporum]|uniref:15816_t:CDS:1 n=1 Tax=Funneliformis geosporum TaxID=1117311 RepID=A0A9W4SJK9_9GLOM|nr:15816_t:CDS:2 [Funneliformis geosporum]
MSDDKGLLEYLPIYSFLFPNEKGSSLYNAYNQDEVDNKLVIKIDQDEDCAPKFSVADDISEVYGLPEIHKCINDQNPLRAVINIDASQEDMEISGVKTQEVFIRICFSFIRALYQILEYTWEEILEGLIIATSSDSSKCSYHILYVPALLIDHRELKAFTELVYTLTGEKFGKFIDRKLPGYNFNLHLIGSAKKGRIKKILQFSLDNGWNEFNHARVQPPTSLGLEDVLQKFTNLVLQKYSNYLRDWTIEEKKETKENFVKVPGFPKAFLKFPSWVKYNEPLSETGKTYVLKHLTISDDVNLLVLSTCYSSSNAVTTRLNLKLYCDIDELRIKKYHGKSDPVEKAHDFSNVKETWMDVDLVAYTSTLKIGVSCTNPKFEWAFCLFNSFIETNAGTNQMLFHMRCIKDYICHIEQRSSNVSIIEKELFQWLLNAKRECLPQELQNRGIFSDIDSIIRNKDVPTIRLWVAFILEKFRSQRLFGWRMIDFLKETEPISKSDENIISLSQAVKANSSIIKAEEISDISNVTILDRETAEFLENKPKKTLDKMWSLE